MMGRQDRDQRQLFYEFSLDEMIPADHLLRRINVFATAVLADLHQQLKAFYSDIGRPSVDPELMIRMLLVGYCYGIRHERRLCQEVALHLAYRWFCKLDLDDKVPHHSTFSVNRLGRFRESEILRHIFERVVATSMAAGLVKGEGFAVDASVMEANASRYYGKAPDELDWSDAQRQKRAVAEYLAGLEAEAPVQEGGDGRGGGPDGEPNPKPDRKPPKVISPSDPSSAWTAKANKRVQFGYGLNYLIDVEHAIIVDVEPTPARTYDEVASTRTMLERTEQRLDLKPDWLAADTAYGTGKLLAWLLGKNITPHKLAFPDGSMTVSGLRREAARGRLRIERIAGKDFTTLQNIDEMRKLCRVPAKALACSNGALGTEEESSSPKPSGSSRTAAGISPQDALRAQLKQSRLEKPSKR
jgi:transposase